MIIASLVVLYLIGSLVTIGAAFNYFQKKYPLVAPDHWREDLAFAIGVSLYGPVGLFVVVILAGGFKYGILIRGTKCSQIKSPIESRYT